MKTVFFLLLFKSVLFTNGQGVNDTIILFDFWQTKLLFARYHFNEDALRIVVNQDSFLLDARKTGIRMRLNNPVKHLNEKRTIGSRAFYRFSRFSGIRIILPKDQSKEIHVQSVKTKAPNKWNNEDFDTILHVSHLPKNHYMLWNTHYLYNDYPCDYPPCRFTDRYQMHSVNLPQIAEIKRGRNKKIKQIENTLEYEVNLVTGTIINYKTGEERKVKSIE